MRLTDTAHGRGMGAGAQCAVVLLLLVESTHSSPEVPLGGALNLFSRYGYLSISMRVVPRNDSGPPWIVREPTVDVFRNSSSLRQPAPSASSAPSGPRPGAAPVFHGDFHMEFCDNLRQLKQAYFRDFHMELLEQPWRAFTASWGRQTLARHLGINVSYAAGQFSYVMLRVARYRDSGRLAPPAPGAAVEPDVTAAADSVLPGDPLSVARFVKKFGSHYVAAFVSGNSLYQVFVYTPQIYSKIKARLRSQGLADLSSGELSNFFSPWYAEHIGTIQSASGNSSLDVWASSRLAVHFYFFTYSSLLKLHGNSSLLKELDSLLLNEALLQLDLRTMAVAFGDPDRRTWFLEVLDNHLKLWQVNM
ncbi:torso-like protein isoform X2 [Bacillus rossius redtenbacheri]|uniref:torso-like protein isoform X2 n=1 Tax=Bacillus rossius redtenbacheri TaxID=93214 RepID=UPI002FDD552A